MNLYHFLLVVSFTFQVSSLKCQQQVEGVARELVVAHASFGFAGNDELAQEERSNSCNRREELITTRQKIGALI
jgi:hypothetical protein